MKPRGYDMKKSVFVFPDLERESVLELPMIALLSGGLGIVVLPFSKVIGLLVMLPCFLVFLHSTRISLANFFIRRRWSRSFARRISLRQLQTLIALEPSRYLLHVRYFGGFDASRLTPAAVLEDQNAGEFMALYPASWKATKIYENAGVPTVSQ